MSTLIDYFRPENPIALVIVVLLWTVFGIWSLALIAAGLKVAKYSGVIRALNNLVPDLVAARGKRAQRRNRGEIPDTTPAEEFRTYLPQGMSHRQPVVRHLESIYSAGCADSRLDIRELLAHTERAISGSDAARRSFLSVFLIVGLLGTLFGLADSILALLKLLQQNADAGSNLIALLGALKGAFAPSISGVLTSILGTVAYAVYQRDWLAPLAGSLREVTLNLWVPELYPTIGQEAAEAAQRSLDAAIKVTESAQTIREDTVALATALRSVEVDTNKYAVGMKELASQVHQSLDPAASAIRDLGSQLDRFNEAMTRWNEFESTLKALYSKLDAGQNQLIEQAGAVRGQVDLQTTQLLSVATDLRDTHRDIFAEGMPPARSGRR